MTTKLGINLTNPTNDENLRVFADLAHFATVEDGADGSQKWEFLQDAGSAASDGDFTLVCKGKDVSARDDGSWSKVFNSAAGDVNGAGFYDAARDLSVWTVRNPKGPGHRSNGIGVRFSRKVEGVHLYAPGVDYRTPPLLNPQFKAWVDRIKPAAPRRFVLRTMDLQRVNNATVKTLADVTKLEDRWWGDPHGIPPGAWPQMATESGCDIHGHIPACVDAAAMAHYVDCIRRTPGEFDAEIGNEVWNTNMKAWGVTYEHALKLGYTSEGDEAGGKAIRAFLATQYVALDRMLREAGCRDRVTILLSCQLARPEWGYDMVDAIRPLDPALRCFDLVVGSPYYEVPFPPPNSDLQQDPDVTAAEILQYAKRIPDFSSVGGNHAINLWDLVDGLAAWAASIGKGWGVYEYGPELRGIDGARWSPATAEYRKLLDTKIAVHDSPEMGEIHLAVTRKLIAKGARRVIGYKGPTAYNGFESLMGYAPDPVTDTPVLLAHKTAAAEVPIQNNPPPPPPPPPLPAPDPIRPLVDELLVAEKGLRVAEAARDAAQQRMFAALEKLKAGATTRPAAGNN